MTTPVALARLAVAAARAQRADGDKSLLQQMKKWIFLIVVFLVAIMSAVVFSAQKTPVINHFYIFGDSLSDTGMVFRSTGGQYPPNPTYFQGRYSNGRVWVEYLAADLGVKQVDNFAWGGATTGSEARDLVPGLLAQVQTFVRRHPRATAGELYILWAGANDYLQGVTNPAQPVANIRKAIKLLADRGATKFLIANLPDLGQLPATYRGQNAEQLSTLTQSHNTNLRRALKQMSQQDQHLQFVTLDANLLYQQAVQEPAKFGLTQVTQACFTGSTTCTNPDQHLFWDSIHPTTAGHRILAESIEAAIKAEFLQAR
jgi:thermolabile hemolysin